MNNAVPEEVICAAIATIAGVHATQVVAATRLETIGIDSMKFTEVLMEVEARMKGEIPTDIVERIYAAPPIKTVADLVRVLA